MFYLRPECIQSVQTRHQSKGVIIIWFFTLQLHTQKLTFVFATQHYTLHVHSIISTVLWHWFASGTGTILTFLQMTFWTHHGSQLMTEYDSTYSNIVTNCLSCMVFARDSIYAIVHICYRPSVCLSVCPSVTRVIQSKTVEVRIMQLSPPCSPMTLVSSRLISPQNSKGNLGSEGTK